MLFSSKPNRFAYVDTKNLDGETNLKDKRQVEFTKNLDATQVANIVAQVACEHPNPFIDNWTATAKAGDQEVTPLSIKNLMLKGTVLRNTEYVIGAVIYTGADTKIVKNSKKPPIKSSYLMKVLNKILITVIILLMLICLMFSILYYNFDSNSRPDFSYLQTYQSEGKLQETAETYEYFLQFLTFFLGFSHIIPISLYVGTEVVKLMQASLIGYDEKMYDENTETFAMSRTSELIEELGQVEFVFSDKTGTLTRNEMVFRMCSIGDEIYGSVENVNVTNSINGDKRAYSKIKDKTNESQKIENFFLALACCHSAFVDHKDGRQVYQSQSPDEIALIEGAKNMGYTLVDYANKQMKIETVGDVTLDLNVLCELPFDSIRKRMSVVIENKGEHWLYTKGADSSMLEVSRMTKESAVAANSY